MFDPELNHNPVNQSSRWISGQVGLQDTNQQRYLGWFTILDYSVIILTCLKHVHTSYKTAEIGLHFITYSKDCCILTCQMWISCQLAFLSLPAKCQHGLDIDWNCDKVHCRLGGASSPMRIWFMKCKLKLPCWSLSVLQSHVFSSTSHWNTYSSS